MYILVVKQDNKAEEKRFVARTKTPINTLLSVAREQYGEDGFHYRVWKDGWCESSFEAWRHIHHETGPAIIVG